MRPNFFPNISGCLNVYISEDVPRAAVIRSLLLKTMIFALSEAKN